MSKIIFRKPKVLVVINSGLLSLLFFFSSFCFILNDTRDYTIINNELLKVKSKNPTKSILLKESNNNEYVISIITQLDSLEKVGSKEKLVSFKQEIGITEDKKFNLIFNQKEYKHLLSQKSINLKWNFKKISNAISYSSPNEKRKDKIVIYLSKPIFTQDNKFAIVYSNNEKTSYLIIFEKIKNEWKEYKIISPNIISPKVYIIDK